jgi:lysophospholipase L1-like esterase
MMKWRWLIYSVGCFMMIILLLEILLRVFDPWGAITYFTDGNTVSSLYIPVGRRDVLPQGQYRYPTWTATIRSDYTRYVPDNGRGACRVAFVGDSVTFGLGVNDAETWVNLLARQHPEWTVINAGISGYNSYGVRLTIEATTADVYVYLISPNDAELQLFHTDIASSRGYQSALKIYWRVWQIQRQGYEHPPQIVGSERRFDSDLAALAQIENLLIVGFTDDPLAQSAHTQFPDVIMIPPYTERISFADPHPSVSGHQQIADAIESAVIEYVQGHCPA